YWCYLLFFTSRRRHTSFSRDWSSDVCSSDLRARVRNDLRRTAGVIIVPSRRRSHPRQTSGLRTGKEEGRGVSRGRRGLFPQCIEIGRASCRERVNNRLQR